MTNIKYKKSKILIQPIGIMLLFLILNSCACIGPNSKKGQEQARVWITKKLKKYKMVNPENRNIRTDVFYKSLGYAYNENDNSYTYDKEIPKYMKPEDYQELTQYYRFYNSGTAFTFSKNINDTVFDSNSFINKDGGISFVLDKNENIIISYSTMNCGRFLERSYEVKGDTLIVKHGDNIGYRVFHYYKEFEVSKSIIDIPEF
ncbi:hypothetical protein ACFQ0I_07980 [Mariniflexile aquimaris]|uniref:Lipoprotein n=1 Tax=Mariniflexile aquimaris TaxID=881009 RepID=A0ABW3BRQ7_9FLAO